MTNIRKAFRFVFFLICIGTALHSPTRNVHCENAAKGSSDLDAWVKRAMTVFQVPGIALAVVKDGKIVEAKGYGVRKLGEDASVNPETLFGIASNTKAFTATALGLLVEEGKIEWDAPVIRYLPSFVMWDSWVTRQLTVRDLLVHRSGLGLGAGDLLWWPPSNYTRKEVIQKIQFIQPATSFRNAYAYDNVLYIVAGEVIEAVSGKTWEQFVTERILKRVGMTNSNVLHSAAGAGSNSASPHAPVEGVVRPIQPFASDTTNPAGGINSNAEDMAKWMMVLLAQGKLPDGTSLFSQETWKELTSMVVPIPREPQPPELAALNFNFYGYALGFYVADYRGHKLVMHTGGLPGYVSRVLLIPDMSLGVAVLTNQESRDAYDSIALHIVDEYLNASDTDWIAAFEKVRRDEDAKNKKLENQTESKRDANSKPSLALDRYAGTFVDDWYGEILITKEKDQLAIRFSQTPLLIGNLQHWQYDTFVVRWKDRELRADAFITFSLNPDGTIDHAKMQAISPETDFSYDFQDLLLKPR